MAVYTDVHYDAQAEEIVICRVDQTGTAITNYPKIRISLPDLVAIVGSSGPGGTGSLMQIRQWSVCVGGVLQKAEFLSTAAHT